MQNLIPAIGCASYKTFNSISTKVSTAKVSLETRIKSIKRKGI